MKLGLRAVEIVTVVAAAGFAVSGVGCAADSEGVGSEVSSPSAAPRESIGQTSQALNTTPGQGYYRIAPAIAPHKSFDLPGKSCPYTAGNQTNSLSLYTYDNVCQSGDQSWYITPKGDGRYWIKQGGPNGRCLDIESGGAGNTLGTWDCGSNTAGQLFYLSEETPGDLYGLWKIKSSYDNRVIDLANASTTNGTQIRPWTDNGSLAQRWILWGNGGMHQDFADDFQGSSIDGNVWNFANFGAGRFNGELQSYAPGQVRQQWGPGANDGHMTIVANNTGNCTGMGCYVSGRVSSKWKRWYRNGTFSARIHYYESNGGNMGTWPAFWALGNNVNEDPVSAAPVGGTCWPMSSAREMDIWEWVRNNNGASYINNGITDNGNCQGGVMHSTNTSSWNWGDWIIASVRIDGGRVKFYRQGIQTWDIPDTGLANEDYAFVINVAVGGQLGGNTGDFNSTSKWASIDVDWVAHETW